MIWPFDIYRHESYLESVVITLVLYKNLGKSDLRKSTASYFSGSSDSWTANYWNGQ